MIKKLKKRVRLLIQIPLILLIVIITAAFLYMNYRNIVESSGGSINRFSTVSNDDPVANGNKPASKSGDSPPAKPGSDENKKADSSQTKPEENDDAELYEFTVKDGGFTYQSTDDESICKTALSLANGPERSGVHNGYFYRLQRTGHDNYTVKLLKDDVLYQKLINMLIVSSVILVLGIALIILLSVLISNIIIKPVAKNEQKQKTFITDTSHELKTPLAVISTNADVLESEIGENKWLGNIQQEITNMEGLIRGLLILSEEENSESRVNVVEFDFSGKAEICASVCETAAYERGLRFESEIEPDIAFMGNEIDAEAIIMPLLENALRYTKDGGMIRLKVSGNKGKCFITVENEGEPIPEEDIDKIFDRFYRGDKARTRDEQHYGLGLSIVKATAEKYSGDVNVHCDSGITAFTVTIKCR